MLYMICLTKNRYLIMLSFFSEIWNFDDTFDEYANYTYFLQTLNILCQISLIGTVEDT
jgi:hypothetical protein